MKVTVSFINESKAIVVEEGSSILEAARRAGVTIESPCNGTGVCGKCRVKLDGGDTVLACETLATGNLRVLTMEGARKALSIVETGYSFDVTSDNFIIKEYDTATGRTAVFGGGALLGTEEGDTREECYGLVVDIGTTTLVVSLVDLATGKELDSASALNPQAVHAQDVLSRMKLASEEGGLHLLHSELIAEINRMIAAMTQKKSALPERIYETIFSGNTCMLHLASGVNPSSMGKFPYTPAIRGDTHIKAREHGLGVANFALVYLPPFVSAYVGADITSGILASQLHERKGTFLFIDIGTNGEMVISQDGRLAATSTAAGPAFEGMNITYGMRAGIGAIEHFAVEDDGRISLKTIGDAPAVGICGSGLMDIVGELVAVGVIDRNGRLRKPEEAGPFHSLGERLIVQDGKTAFRVSDEVILTQKDIRQVQLAKGAVRTGVEFLLKSQNLQARDVDKVLIAGSFGYHLRARSLVNLGLLPADFEGKIEFLGNTSKSGGHAFLLNKTYRKQMTELVKRVEVVELSNYKDFDKVFVKCLGFERQSERKLEAVEK
jgi:uncharacterized 2Fe-2S/4Fe-4S cluster protein (DUF4445 family)